MKGIILAGGTGSRLYPLTTVVNKQLIPVYDKPMIYYPMSTLIQCGIREICIISSSNYLSFYKALFGDGKRLGMNIKYRLQEKPNGIGEAFIIAADFIGADGVMLILGDNIFHGHFTKPIAGLEGGLVYAYEVKDPREYGVVELNDEGMAISIEEKPIQPKSNWALPGLYYFDNKVIKYASELVPSKRGELEITDIMKRYMEKYELRVLTIDRGIAWLDAGSPKTLYQASSYIQAIQERQGVMVGCIEEEAYRVKFIDFYKFKCLQRDIPQSDYRTYLERVK